MDRRTRRRMAAMHQWSHVAATGLMEPVEEELPLCQEDEDDE